MTLPVALFLSLASLPLARAQGGSKAAAEEAFSAAEKHLAEGQAAEAEASAREALRLSLRFVPEQEIEARPDKGLLFEDMILEARARYRERRARYFGVLGAALTAQEKYRAARKAYRRSPSLEGLLDMASHPDLGIDERVGLLIEAYLSPGADTGALETRLLETGAFRSRHALDAALDRRRFERLQERFDRMELVDGAFPELSIVTDAGTLNTTQLFRTGNLMIVYVPVVGCPRCSEELDGLTGPVTAFTRGGGVVDVVALVREVDLPGARRIVRLLGMPIGVGRKDVLPPALTGSFLETGEIRIVGRGGLVQIRIPMSDRIAAGEIRPRVEAAIGLLDDGATLRADREDKARALVTLERERGASERTTFFEWVETVDRLEAGPAPLDDLYAEIGRLAQSVAREATDARAMGLEMLEALSRLEGAHSAKTTALGLVGERVGELLLERAQSFDETVRRTATGTDGVWHTAVAVGAGQIYLQRSYRADDGLRHFDFALEIGASASELSVSWAGQSAAPLGVASVEEGGVFRFESEAGCRALKLVATATGDIAYESCDGRVIDGELVEFRSALVDEVATENPPLYYRRDVVTAAEPRALERGLAAFEQGDLAGALEAFEEAADEIDDEAPYDASDLLYNRARALELQGKRSEALDLYRSLGDVSYQYLVDQRANAIETGQPPGN